MKTAWAVLYVMASIWVVGLVMSATGVPFGKYGLAGPPPRPAAVAPAAAADYPVVLVS